MKGVFVTLAVAVVVFFTACSDPLGSEDIPDINGTWIVETDFLVEQNTCALPNSLFEERIAGELLNVWQDPTDRSRIQFGVLEGALKPDGAFVTREFKTETVYRQFPNGVTGVCTWIEGKFSGNRVDVKFFSQITPPPSYPECEVIRFYRANRTAGG